MVAFCSILEKLDAELGSYGQKCSGHVEQDSFRDLLQELADAHLREIDELKAENNRAISELRAEIDKLQQKLALETPSDLSSLVMSAQGDALQPLLKRALEEGAESALVEEVVTKMAKEERAKAVTMKDCEGCGPLHWCTASSSSKPCDTAKTIGLLGATGCNPDTTNNAGDTAVCYAVRNRAEPATIEALLALRANVNHASRHDETPLMLSTRTSNIECVRVLLSWRADANAGDAFGSTPIIEAANVEDKELVQVLLNHRADPTKTDAFGISAIDFLGDEDAFADLVQKCKCKGSGGSSADEELAIRAVIIAEKEGAAKRAADELQSAADDVNAARETAMEAAAKDVELKKREDAVAAKESGLQKRTDEAIAKLQGEINAAREASTPASTEFSGGRTQQEGGGKPVYDALVEPSLTWMISSHHAASMRRGQSLTSREFNVRDIPFPVTIEYLPKGAGTERGVQGITVRRHGHYHKAVMVNLFAPTWKRFVSQSEFLPNESSVTFEGSFISHGGANGGRVMIRHGSEAFHLNICFAPP